MDRKAWCATVHSITKSQTRLGTELSEQSNIENVCVEQIAYVEATEKTESLRPVLKNTSIQWWDRGRYNQTNRNKTQMQGEKEENPKLSSFYQVLIIAQTQIFMPCVD